MSEKEKHKKFRSIYWDENKEKWQYREKKSPRFEQCAALSCRGIRACWYSQEGKFCERKFCHKCYARLWRINNPFSNLYRDLKNSASRRGHAFDLTYGEFLIFCLDSNYCERQIRFNSTSLTFDRINPKLGYSFSNLRIIPMGQNVAFENKRRGSSNSDPF